MLGREVKVWNGVGMLEDVSVGRNVSSEFWVGKLRCVSGVGI